MTEKYALYRGENINTVSLWVRRDGKEYPIYANTRGQCEWFDFETDVYENTEPYTLSDELKEWLAHVHRVENGLIDMDEGMFPARAIEDDKPDAEPEWYEIEVLNHIGNPSMTDEQEKLCGWAYEQVQE